MSSDDASDIVLQAARVDELGKHVFSVGPFGARVGFAYQQNRALNLVHCLHKSEIIERNSSIAIVGGGLAGVSVRLALKGLGYDHVDLFEKEAEVLQTQQFADHRPIHPNFNDWPIADRCSATTNLPFLNWFTNDASSVVNRLRSDWDKIYLSEIPRAYTRRRIERIRVRSEGKQAESVQLICPLPIGRPAAAPERQDPSYSHVIVATGFGSELYTEYGLSGSYWDPDKIDRIRTSETKCFVTATGDGGLMDCIRLCCIDVSGSSLLIELMAQLRHSKYKYPLESLNKLNFERSPIEEQIKELEKQASLMLPTAMNEGDHPFGTDNDNSIARYLARGYKRIALRLPTGICQFLDRHVVNVDNVTLLGRLEAPFSYATAPINKLMIAYLLVKRPKLYKRAYIEWKDDAGAKSGTVRFKSGSSRALDKNTFVIRLGSSPPVYGFSKQFAKRNRTLMRSVAALSTIERDNEAFCRHIGNVACADKASDRYVKHRRALAEAYAEQYLGVCLTDAYCPYSSLRYFTFDTSKKEFRNRADDLYLRTGGFPHDLFGIPLVGETHVRVTSALEMRS